MSTEIHIDLETYCELDIRNVGLYKYVRHPSFEVMLFAYCFGSGPVKCVDLKNGQELPEEVIEALQDPNVTKYAYNAAFERESLVRMGYKTKIKEWNCVQVKAAYCGYALNLKGVTLGMGFDQDKAKLATGKALIKYFCMPCKPTKVNGGRTRNLPSHDMHKWSEFIRYCEQDVVAEVEIDKRLKKYKIPKVERRLYVLDQIINRRGMLVDTDLARGAVYLSMRFEDEIKTRLKEITGLENPNSPVKLKEWLSAAMKTEISSLAKEHLNPLIAKAEQIGGVIGTQITEVLEGRKMLSRASVKKYKTMLDVVCSDGRFKGSTQFYGAGRTGRWAGRLVQPHNLTKHKEELDKLLFLMRGYVKERAYKLIRDIFVDVADILSQLTRTAFIAPKGKLLGVADYSAIEARVTAWYAKEKWRLEVFNTHGKVYEKSASMMFGVPMEKVTKGSDLRAKGKVAELALGFGGGVEALKQMGGAKMGLSVSEMDSIVKKWRKASPGIASFWKDVEKCAFKALDNPDTWIRDRYKRLKFHYDGKALRIKLPSGRCLFYQDVMAYEKTTNSKYGPWTRRAIKYKSWTNGGWRWTDTYGGKLVENIVQATARDVLAHAMLRLHAAKHRIVLHVHDEAGSEFDEDTAKQDLTDMCRIMGEPLEWAPGLPLGAEGYLTQFYKKD